MSIKTPIDPSIKLLPPSENHPPPTLDRSADIKHKSSKQFVLISCEEAEKATEIHGKISNPTITNINNATPWKVKIGPYNMHAKFLSKIR
jgi:hypothetical protein